MRQDKLIMNSILITAIIILLDYMLISDHPNLTDIDSKTIDNTLSSNIDELLSELDEDDNDNDVDENEEDEEKIYEEQKQKRNKRRQKRRIIEDEESPEYDQQYTQQQYNPYGNMSSAGMGISPDMAGSGY